MKILFVCKYNAFRSRVAEEYFRKINKNRKVKIMGSRGLIMGGDSDPVQRQEAKRLLGINIAKRKPMSLAIKDIIEADRIIVVANDVPRIIFDYMKGLYSRKVVIWRIRDEQKRNRKNIIKIISAIKKKVDRLERKL